MRVEWIDIEDQQPEHRQWVWFISADETAEYYERNNFACPDQYDVDFGEYWKDGEVEVNPDMPMVKAKWWYPYPQFKK